MASNSSLCGVCDKRHLTKTSEVWCCECDEGLCADCKEHHSMSKGTKNHATISIVDYKKLPYDVLQISQVCKIHNERYEVFCKKHDCPCCKKCIETHNSCKSLIDINEVSKNVKNSNALYEIEQTLLEVVEKIKLIETNREDNLTSLDKTKREIEDKITQTRTDINNYLDKLQDSLMKELMAVEQKESNKIRKLLTTLKKKEKEITQFQASIENIKQHASELQIFLAMKHIENTIQSLTKSDITNQVNMSYHIDNYLQQITANVQKFAEINVSSDPCDVSFQKRWNKQAQIMVARPSRNIHNLTLMLQKRINTDLSEVRGCSLLPDGRIAFSCYHQREVRVFKSDGWKDFEINNIGSTFDVVNIGDDALAVTSGFRSDKINIIDTKNKKLKKTIRVKSNNEGVTHKDGNLIYCAGIKGLQMISLDNETITNVINSKLSPYAYVSTFGDRLFYTKHINHSVTCCDYHGNILWTFCDESVLKTPLCTTVDKDGNLFVVGCGTENVVVFSFDGQRYRQLLSRKDGLVYPMAVHYDISTNKLVVANKEKDAFLYEVK